MILLKNISKIFLKNIFFWHLGRPYQLLFSSLCSKMSKNTYVFINPQIPSLCTVIISQWWRNPGMMRLYWGAPLTLTQRQVPPSVDLNIGSLLSWAWVTTHTALSGVNNWDSLWNTGHLLPLVLTWTRVANNVWNLSQTIFLNVTIDWSFMALISSALFVWCILVESVNMDLG